MILNLNLQTTKHGHDCLLCQDMFVASLGGCGMAGWNLRCNLIKAVRCGPLWLSLPTSCQHDSLQWQKSKGYGWKSQEWALRVEESAFGDPVYAWPSSSVASCVLEGFELRKSDRKNWVPFFMNKFPLLKNNRGKQKVKVFTQRAMALFPFHFKAWHESYVPSTEVLGIQPGRRWWTFSPTHDFLYLCASNTFKP